MRSLLAGAVIVLLSLGVGACSGSRVTAGSPPSGSARQTAIRDAPAGGDSEDKDADASGDDDLFVMGFGHPASGTTARTVTLAVKRYYAAAALDDGAKACRMLIHTVAEAVPEDYGEGGSPEPGTQEKSCATMMSRLFERRHRLLRVKSATLKVIAVRVETGRALAILHFAGNPEPQKIALHREGSTWKIWELLDSKMP